MADCRRFFSYFSEDNKSRTDMRNQIIYLFQKYRKCVGKFSLRFFSKSLGFLEPVDIIGICYIFIRFSCYASIILWEVILMIMRLSF